MRHLYGVAKLARHGQHRRAMMRNLATALFTHERITTTQSKAKALRPVAERLITLAKRGDLHARRLAAREIHDHPTLQKLFGELAERFRARNGGYTRVLSIGRRRGDQGMVSLIELVDYKLKIAEPEPTKAAPKAKPAAPKPEAAKPSKAAAPKDDAEKAAPKAKKAPAKAKAPAKKAAAKDAEKPAAKKKAAPAKKAGAKSKKSDE